MQGDKSSSISKVNTIKKYSTSALDYGRLGNLGLSIYHPFHPLVWWYLLH